jgi:hypothetical protein
VRAGEEVAGGGEPVGELAVSGVNGGTEAVEDEAGLRGGAKANAIGGLGLGDVGVVNGGVVLLVPGEEVLLQDGFERWDFAGWGIIQHVGGDEAKAEIQPWDGGEELVKAFAAWVCAFNDATDGHVRQICPLLQRASRKGKLVKGKLDLFGES